LKGKAKSREGNDRLLNQSVGLDHSSERSVCEDGGYSVRYEAVDGGCGCRRKPRTSVIELKVAKEDLGKIIGKQGRTAQAIRTILNAASKKMHKRFVLELIE
jgi:predicted RNA-binding protein YlqC (UPF0109 family)